MDNARHYRFPINARLLNSQDYRNVFDQPLRSASREVCVLARPNKKNNARLGIIVSKRVVKTSVARNHIRRLIRELFRYQQHDLVGLDIVVLIRAYQHNQNEMLLKAKIQKHWQHVVRAWKG